MCAMSGSYWSKRTRTSCTQSFARQFPPPSRQRPVLLSFPAALLCLSDRLPSPSPSWPFPPNLFLSFLSAPPHRAPRDPDATHSPLPNEARRCHPAASLAFPPHLNSLFGYVMESSLHTLQHTAPCPPAPHRPPRAQLWL